MPFASDMQVLTLQGWRDWSMVKATEKLAVPDPAKRMFTFEAAKITAFQTDEPLHKCSSAHIAYSVTADHSMHVKKGETATLLKAGESAGGFDIDTLAGYRFVALEGPKNPAAQLAGFWLGDGYKISKNRIGFGLKKDRKKAYLRDILKRLGVPWEEADHTNRPGYRDFVLVMDGKVKDAVETYIHDWQALAKNKHINRAALENDDDGDVVRALFDALMNSDGHVKQDRPQLQFTSTSNGLHSDFQLLSAMLGRDSHFTKHNLSLSYNPDRNQTFAIQKGEVQSTPFEGRVYCAETSNGLLFVRGNGQQFGFVAGCS